MLIYPFFPKNSPEGGGLPDVTRRGTNYLHTTLLKTYPKDDFSDSKSIFSWIQRPQNRGGPHENIFKRLIYPCFPKMAGGGGRFTRFHQMWHLFCLFILPPMLPKWHYHLRNGSFLYITTFMLPVDGKKGFKHFVWMQCLFKGHVTIEHCPCMGAVVLWSARRPFVAFFSVKRREKG